MHPDAFVSFHSLIVDASRCIRMHQDAAGCSRILPDASGTKHKFIQDASWMRPYALRLQCTLCGYTFRCIWTHQMGPRCIRVCLCLVFMDVFSRRHVRSFTFRLFVLLTVCDVRHRQNSGSFQGDRPPQGSMRVSDRENLRGRHPHRA